MPTYDFQCKAGHVHEALVSFGVVERTCPECGDGAARVFSVPGRDQFMFRIGFQYTKSTFTGPKRPSRVFSGFK